MKVALVLFAALALVAADPLFEHCPDTMLNIPLQPTTNVHKLLGIWYFIRKGPIPDGLQEKVKNIDCVSSGIWRDYDGPKDEYHHVNHMRKDGKKHVSKSNTMTLVPAGEEGVYENNFVTTKTIMFQDSGEEKKIHIQEKLVETDEGKSWALVAACVKKEGGNSTLLWIVKSRYQRMDPKIEQDVVEKVEKYGGVGPSLLRGIGQTHCYE